MIAQELEVSLHMAFVEARQQRHEFITVEHLLMALLDNPSAAEVLRACSANIDDLRKSLVQFVKENTPTVGGTEEVDTQPTLGFQRVIQRAIMHVQSTGSGKKEVTGANVLVAIFGEKDSHAVYYLHQQGVTRLDVVNFIAHGIRKSDPPEPTKSGESASSPEAEKEEADGKGSPLEQFTQNLNQQARDGKIDPLIGRELEVERVIQILCRRRKNNPLLVGEAGVGKTAIAEGLAWRITQNEVPEILANATVYALDMGALLAGTKYRGDFEQRLKGVLKNLKDMPNAVLFIDEIHTLIGAGAASGGTLDASNLLKPALSSGAMKCIGATTFTEYRGIFEKDAALSRRFQKVDVVEPSVEQTIEILKGLKSRFEEHHSVKYAVNALQAAAELSAKFINDRHLPDKAIDVIDEAGAAQRILPKNKQKKTITRLEVEEIVAKIARIPPASVSSDDRSKLQSLDRDLKSVVFGQDPALDALASAIKMARSGLGKPDKPIGAFLFSGPTGVGKTEAAKQLAFILGIELIRFDMSEYMERHAVSRLIGAPPGYVGFDQGGLLTEAISKKPHAVLLLDEIEKAHPGRLQRAAAGDGPWHADRQQRAQGRLPQRHPRHDDECRRGDDEQGHDRLHQLAPGRRRDGRHQAAVHARVPQPARRDGEFQGTRRGDHPAGGRQVPAPARGPADREEGRRHLHRRAAQASRQEGVRSADGRAADAAADPGHDPPGARRRAAVRPAGRWRTADGRRRRRRCGAARHPAEQAQRQAEGGAGDGGLSCGAFPAAPAGRGKEKEPAGSFFMSSRRAAGRAGPSAAGSRILPVELRRAARTHRHAALATRSAGRRRPRSPPRRTPRCLRHRKGRARSPRYRRRPPRRSPGNVRPAPRSSAAARLARQAGAEVEHMGELVDDDVVAPPRRRAGAAHVAPGEHHRAAFDRLAGERLVVLVHHAVVVGHRAPRLHRVGMDDDADEAVVPAEPELAGSAGRPARRWRPPCRRARSSAR